MRFACEGTGASTVGRAHSSPTAPHPFLQNGPRSAPWLVRHQSFLRNRFVVRSSGRTPELTMSKFQSPSLSFGEAVLAKESGAQQGKLDSSWDLGIWMRRSTRTNEHLVGTRTGVIRARTVKRRQETLKWDRELCEAMNFVPWLIDGPVERPETGWTPTLGCKACDEESSGVKRRADRSITPHNAQRSKLFSVCDFAK